ncbi:hypothetical protein FisN_1Lh066 [Fistulifera solaris]|uniref:Uncharacterized protein n=1 Tax=Fistulifera solaris TaxID=1519565 RepID=A0A1Z5JC71_FISSO|nr:hypothetical protein FisN_1Lh066 [Fistulifera solaris]|eukprot:GAX11575.1 hypothetical protein FisN_1Lh066 [Fistulifera solaris]
MAKRSRPKKNKSKDDHDASAGDPLLPSPSALPEVAVDIPKTFSRMRLEAIFYPKFENEQKENQRTREQMKERVLDKQGYLEASIKHSGSLILWSGGERFYSKNSTNNVFTDCAEILLRQHFVRAYWNDDNNNGDRMFRECSEYVEQNRYTLAFEVVTSFLGDHGDRPNRDFLILTAVAVKSASPYFMPTLELVDLAQRFRLPHNDAWVFSTPTAVDSLFRIYDNSRETGLASTINPALSEAADVHVSSMYPHEIFQGDIMEGIVIRYVASPGDLAATLDRVKELSKKSIEILKSIVPSTLAACPNLVKQKSDKNTHSAVIRADLRQIYKESQVCDERAFDLDVRNLLEESQKERQTVKVKQFASIDITQVVETLQQSSDLETKRIARTISLLASLKDRVQYALFQEQTSDTNRWLCIVHVLFDRTFPKYRERNKDSLDMELFRGFCIELMEYANEDEPIDDATMSHISMQKQEEPLMLKMKLLPYMIRTFCCRNGLATIKSGGPSAFSLYCQNLLSKWGISRQGMEAWQPFLDAWGVYASAVLAESSVIPDDKVASLRDGQPKVALNSRNFLDHVFYFTRLYDTGYYSGLSHQPDESGSFRGLVIVVGPDAVSASAVADFLAQQWCSAKRLDDVSKLDKSFMERSLMRGGGHVLSVGLLDNYAGAGKVRDLMKEFKDVIAMVLFDVVGNSDIMKEPKTKGLLKSWQKIDCGKMFTLSGKSLFREDGSLEADEKFQTMVNECTFRNSCDKPGILVFFPQIPGCGKSCLTSDEDRIRVAIESCGAAEKSRKVLVIAGDKTKDKYWPKVKHTRLRDTSSVVLADKNAPTPSWGMIGEVCELTQAVAVPVLAQDALQTTDIAGARSLHGDEEADTKHVYPYSLAYLAVCMARVLDRSQGSHPGKLDRGTKRACIIVLQFYSMYRNLTAEQFEDVMRSKFEVKGATFSVLPISIPFFRTGAMDEGLSSHLQEVLIDGLKLLFGIELDREKIKSLTEAEKQDAKRIENEALDEMDIRLRAAISLHRDSILALSSDEETTKEKFVTQLKEKVAACDEMKSYDSKPSKFIKLASLDVNHEDIMSILKSFQGKPQLQEVLKNIVGDREIEEVVFHGSDRRIVAKPHVTLAHFSDMAQDELRKNFDHLCGRKVLLSVVALFWSRDNVALEVKVDNTTTCGIELPTSRNDFTHITVWVHDNSSAVKSNQLPKLVENQEASKFDFPQPFLLEGSLSLWES